MRKDEKNLMNAACDILIQFCQHYDCAHCPMTLHFKPCVECPVETICKILNKAEQTFGTCGHVKIGIALGRHEFPYCEINNAGELGCNCEDCESFEVKNGLA